MAVTASAKLIALWFAIVMAVALLVPFWHDTDLWLLTRVLGYGTTETLDDRVIAIDLGAKPGQLRPPLIAILSALCAPSGDPAHGSVSCTAHPNALPDAVAFDIVFTANSGDPRLARSLANLIGALTAGRVGVYGAISIDPAEAPIPQIADALSAVGHTEMHVVPYVPTGFAWYRQVETIAGIPQPALPLAVKGLTRTPVIAEAARETIIPLGPHPAFSGAVLTPARAIAAALADRRLAAARSGTFARKIVVIGNAATDVPIPGDRTGFELVVWSISDRVADPDGRTRMTYDTDSPLMVILTVAAAALCAALYRAIFARVRTRPSPYLVAFAGAISATLVAVGAVEALLLANHRAFAQLSLVVVGTLTAGGVSARASAALVRHERFLKRLCADHGRAPDDEYDVFISYARDAENAAWVAEHVYEPLKRTRGADGRALRIFFDRDSIVPGNDWYEKIVGSINGSRCFVPVYSRGYFQRWFCRDELELALLCRSDKPNFIIPLTRIGYRLPKRYAAIQALDANSPLFATDLPRIVLQACKRDRDEAAVADK